MDAHETIDTNAADNDPVDEALDKMHRSFHTTSPTPPVNKLAHDPPQPYPDDRTNTIDTSHLDVAADSSLFVQPPVQTSPQINGNRQQRLDTNLSGTSTLSTDGDGSTSSSGSNSDSEDDLLNSSAVTDEADDEEVEVGRDLHHPEDVDSSDVAHGDFVQSHSAFVTEEYPGDEEDMGLDISDDDDDEEDEDAIQEPHQSAVVGVHIEPFTDASSTNQENKQTVDDTGDEKCEDESSEENETGLLKGKEEKDTDLKRDAIISEASDTINVNCIEEELRISESTNKPSEAVLNTNMCYVESVSELDTHIIHTSEAIEHEDNANYEVNAKQIFNKESVTTEVREEVDTNEDASERSVSWATRNGDNADVNSSYGEPFENGSFEKVESDKLDDKMEDNHDLYEKGKPDELNNDDELNPLGEGNYLEDDDMEIEPDVSIHKEIITENELKSIVVKSEIIEGSSEYKKNVETDNEDQPELIGIAQDIQSSDDHTNNDGISDMYIEDIEPNSPDQPAVEIQDIPSSVDQHENYDEDIEPNSQAQSETEDQDISSSIDQHVNYEEDIERNSREQLVNEQPKYEEDIKLNSREQLVDAHDIRPSIDQHENYEESDVSIDEIEPSNENQLDLVNQEHDIHSSVDQVDDESENSNEDLEQTNRKGLENTAFESDIRNLSQVEDMDLEEDEMIHSEDANDERTLSVPPSPKKSANSESSGLSQFEVDSSNTEIALSTNIDQEVAVNIEEASPESIQSKDSQRPDSEPAVCDPRRRSSCSSLVHNSTEALPDILMSSPPIKNTDEMKYFLKHQLQYSDLGKLFGNAEVPLVTGQGSDYAQYLGLQPALKFKCFKCAEANFSSLAELKQHQTTCLKQIPNPPDRSPHRGASTVGLRSSLNSDNAMDVDLTENTAAKPQSVAPPNSSSEPIDAKIRITRKVYLCSACGTYYENWNLFYHMREVHQKFICLLCLGIFPSAERLVHHLEGKHNSRPDVFEHKEQLLSTLKDQCYMMCTVCEHIFSEHDDFTSHSCENYIKACALCGLKFIHKPQCKAGASHKTLARQRREKNKGKHRPKKIALDASNNAANIPSSNNVQDVDVSSGLNFSNTLFGSTSSMNGIMSGNFELPQSILSNQIPDAPGDSYVVPPLVPEPPLSYLPQKLLQDEKPQEYPTNSSSSSMSSSPYLKSITNNAPTTAIQPRSSGKIWPPINNGYIDPPETTKSQNNNNQSASSQATVPTTLAPSSNLMSSGKNISLFDHRESLSISEDYLDNRDMEIINSYISDFDTFANGGTGKNVSLTDIEPMQSIISPCPRPMHQEPPPSLSTPVEQPRLVPKLKLNLSKAFQTPIESEESSTESDEDEDEEEGDEEAAEDEGEDEEEEDDEVHQTEEERFKQASKMYQTPSNASRTPHAMSPHSFAAPSIPPPTPPHLHRSIADSDIQIDVERTSDMAIDETQDEDEEPAHESMHHSNDVSNDITNDPESEDVNIEDEDKESAVERSVPLEEPLPQQPLVPFDGIHLADEDVLPTELILTQPIDQIPIQDFLRLCIRATYPYCLYCNHARKIAVDGHHLALHMLAHHRFNATVDSITAEELLPITIVQRIKSHLDKMPNIYFNLDTFNTATPEKNVICPKSFECFQCRFQARHHKDLYLHNRKMHLKTIVVCLMCKANFYSYSELSGHICPGHPKHHDHLDVHFRCVLCNLDRIPSAFRLMVHLRKKHGACDICLEYCDDQSRLSSHVCKHKLHHLCYRCGISYRNKADITKHLFWKHGTESQLCKKCLQKKWPHVYHFCVPPTTFVCEVCSISFKRAVALKVHKRLHSDDHPYPCTEDDCEKKFISRKLLLKHVARHSTSYEPEEIKPTDIKEQITTDEKQAEIEIKPETIEIPMPLEVEEKPAAPKPLIDIIKDLPAPNLSESDSSDESDSEQRSRPVSKSLLSNAPADPADKDDDEQQAPIADIWDNFKSYQANQKQTFADEDREFDPPPPPSLHVSQSDHDYCNMFKKINMSGKKSDLFIPLLEIKQEPIDEDEVVVPRMLVAKPSKEVETKMNKSPKKGRSPKKALDKSGSDSSSSDSDSSCSCGSNCSCTSGSSSDGSSSSSSSSSGDSSSSEARRKKAAKLAKRRSSQRTPTKEETSETIDVGTEDKKTVPSNDPDLIILESDLETEESETDEEFYDEHPLRMANQLLALKRKQLMLQTSMSPLNSFDIVENSRPSTPSLPPAEEELKSRKQKAKKRKKDRKNAKCVPSLKLNLSTQSVTIIEEPQLDLPPPMNYQHHSRPTAAPLTPPPLASPLFTNNFAAIINPANNKYHLKPRLSTGSSCSDVDSSLKRSKRRRIPNKFYGYTSDEDVPPSGTTPMTPQDAFKPQPPPNLTWNKEDLPQTPTVIRTPPIKTIIKLPTGHNTFSRNSSLEYPTIDPNPRFKTDSSPLDQPPALPSRHSQPPIPPIIIRPNRIIQPPLVEPLRVPAVPVHHIVPPSNPDTEVDTESSDSDSSNDGHLQIQQTPTPPVIQNTPQPFQRLVTTPLRITSAMLAAKTPKPRNATTRKRPATKFPPTPKAKRSKNDNLPKTPAIPAQYLPFLDPPEPSHQPRSMTTHIPISAVANQIRYPIMPPAGSRPARAGESVYCYCRCPYDEVSEMIACDGDDCPIEWFHFECVNIMVPPKGTWYCPQCRPKYATIDDDDGPPAI